MSFRFLFALHVFFSLPLTGQQVIEIYVKDEFGKPLEGALCKWLNEPGACITGLQGKCQLASSSNKDSMLIQYLGYKNFIKRHDQIQSIIEVQMEVEQKELALAEINSTWAPPEAMVAHVTLNEKTLSTKATFQDVPYLLQHLPSSVSTSDAGNGVGYTGIRIRGLDPTQINVLINGVPLNDGESQQVFWVDLPDLIASASDLQVQRGIGSSGPGQVAFGSSILINTNKFSTHPFANLELGIGSFNTYKTSIEAGTGTGPQGWNVRGRASVISSSGYIDRASSNMVSGGFSVLKLMANRSLKFHFFDGLEKTYQAWYGVPIQYVQSGKLTYNTAGTERTGEPYHNQIDRYRQTHFQFIHHEALKNGWSFQNTLHYTPGNGYYEEYKAAQNPEDYNLQRAGAQDVIRRRNLDNHFYGFIHALDFQKHRYHFKGGLSWNKYKGAHFGEVIQFGNELFREWPRYYEFKASKLNTMVFINNEWKSGDLTWSGDIQYRYVQYVYEPELLKNVRERNVQFNFINPKLGISWQVLPSVQVFGFSGLAHREPNRKDYVEADQDLPKAERMWDNEMGIRINKRHFKGEQIFYSMSYRNQLIPTGAINDVGAYIRTNVHKSQRVGMETSIEYTLSNKWFFWMNLNLSKNFTSRYTDFIDDWDTGLQTEVDYSNQPMAFAPSRIFNLGFQSIIAQKRMNSLQHQMQAEVMFQNISKQYLDGTGQSYSILPGYSTVQGSVVYSIGKKGKEWLDVKFQCNNVFNARYSSNGWLYRFNSPSFNPVPDDPYSQHEQANTYHQKGLYPQAGRNFIISIKKYF